MTGQTHEPHLSGESLVRLTVNIGPDTQQALKHLMETKGVTLTEALRRLVGYGDLVFREIEKDNRVFVREGDTIREVTLL